MISIDIPPHRVLFKLANMSGGRQGELLGLKWSDIDWDNNQIHFQRTFNNSAWYKPKPVRNQGEIAYLPHIKKERAVTP